MSPAATPRDDFVLVLSCPDRPGIVAFVSTLLFDTYCNILEAQQYEDRETGLFFMRVRFTILAEGDIAAVRRRFPAVAEPLSMEWSIRACSERQRVLILVSKFDHCLADLLYRWHTGELAMDLVGIVANYPRSTYAHLDFGDVPFHHLPVAAEGKAEQEAAIWSIVQATGADLVVLARYMQILSDDMATKLAGRCINIHHSFLPGFKGARPYQQAHKRGVKLIGATAHYVTAALDEGPIIEQDIQRISHRDAPEDLVRKGRDIERRVLARAIAWHLDGRVVANGAKTVVFED